MRTILISIVLLYISVPGYSQYFPVDTARLNQTYTALIAGPSTVEKQKAFLDAFPATYSEFMMVYQYVPDPKYNLAMYYKADKHILEGLGKISLIPDTIYCDKLINLCINGRWGADAPNYLKTILHKALSDRPDAMLKLLKVKMSGQQFSFWYFYFNSLYVKENGVKGFQHLKKLISDTYPSLMREMESAYHSSYGKASLTENFPTLLRKE